MLKSDGIIEVQQMDKIGNTLKQKRLELGLTIEEISEKTRLTIKHIKAIEEGDISYFKDDLSYLRFFLKSYCDVLGLDFEEMKGTLQDSIEDYTTSFSKKAIAQHEAIERGVKENAEKLKKTKTKPKKAKQKKVRRRRKIDMSLVSFLAIIVVILIGLIFAFVMWMQRSNGDEDNLVVNKPPVAPVDYSEDANEEKPSQKPTTPEVEEPKEPEKKEMVITKVNDTQYTLENLNDGDEIDIEITMGSNTSFRALVDGTVLSNPANKVYQAKSVIHVRESAVKGKKIQLAFGYMLKNSMTINGTAVELPASVTNKNGSIVIQFDVKGE